jgi:hypothetical protein
MLGRNSKLRNRKVYTAKTRRKGRDRPEVS